MKKSLFRSGVLLHGGTCKTQNAAFLRSFSVVLFLLPLLFAHTAYGDINAEPLKAAAAGNTARVEQLLKQGANVNVREKDGSTALMWAADSGFTETLKVLIAAGADVNATDKNGTTALMFATRMENTRIVNILKQAEAQAGASNAVLKGNFFSIVAVIIIGIAVIYWGVMNYKREQDESGSKVIAKEGDSVQENETSTQWKQPSAGGSMARGAGLSIVLTFPLAALIAVMFRFPVPFAGYQSGMDAIGPVFLPCSSTGYLEAL